MRIAIQALVASLVLIHTASAHAGEALTPASALRTLQAGHDRQMRGVPLAERLPLTESAIASRPLIACVMMPAMSNVPVDWLFDAYPSDVLRVSGTASGVAAIEQSIRDAKTRAVIVIGNDEQDAAANMESLVAEAPALRAAVERGDALLMAATLGDDLRLNWLGLHPDQDYSDAASLKPADLHPATLFPTRNVAVATPTASPPAEAMRQTVDAPPVSESRGQGVVWFVVGLAAAGGVTAWSLHCRGRTAMPLEVNDDLPENDGSVQLREALELLQLKLRRWQSDWKQTRGDVEDELDEAEGAARIGQVESRAAAAAVDSLRVHFDHLAAPAGIADLLRRVDELGMSARLLAGDVTANGSAETADACLTALSELRSRLMSALRAVDAPVDAAVRAESAVKAAEERWSQVRSHLGSARVRLGADRAAESVATRPGESRSGRMHLAIRRRFAMPQLA